MSRLAVIPARGGSKRIPRKNIKSFDGKPMIAWSIEAAISSGCFEHIWVSTDDNEIAEVAQSYGAIVPFLRPEQLADDYATTMDVMAHAVKHFIDTIKGEELEAVCCIYATAPFIKKSDIQKGYRTLTDHLDLSYVFSATTYAFPIQRAIKLNDSSRVQMFEPSQFAIRSQDLEEAYHDAGQFYWGRPKPWLEKEPIFSESSQLIVLPRYRVQDIDTQEDWERAEFLSQAMKSV